MATVVVARSKPQGGVKALRSMGAGMGIGKSGNGMRRRLDGRAVAQLPVPRIPLTLRSPQGTTCRRACTRRTSGPRRRRARRGRSGRRWGAGSRACARARRRAARPRAGCAAAGGATRRARARPGTPRPARPARAGRAPSTSSGDSPPSTRTHVSPAFQCAVEAVVGGRRARRRGDSAVKPAALVHAPVHLVEPVADDQDGAGVRGERRRGRLLRARLRARHDGVERDVGEAPGERLGLRAADGVEVRVQPAPLHEARRRSRPSRRGG